MTVTNEELEYFRRVLRHLKCLEDGQLHDFGVKCRVTLISLRVLEIHEKPDITKTNEKKSEILDTICWLNRYYYDTSAASCGLSAGMTVGGFLMMIPGVNLIAAIPTAIIGISNAGVQIGRTAVINENFKKLGLLSSQIPTGRLDDAKSKLNEFFNMVHGCQPTSTAEGDKDWKHVGFLLASFATTWNNGIIPTHSDHHVAVVSQMRSGADWLLNFTDEELRVMLLTDSISSLNSYLKAASPT
ncbi:hypothetical protein HDU67_004087, partial [Dinochytrium kinnereticum]